MFRCCQALGEGLHLVEAAFERYRKICVVSCAAKGQHGVGCQKHVLSFSGGRSALRKWHLRVLKLSFRSSVRLCQESWQRGMLRPQLTLRPEHSLSTPKVAAVALPRPHPTGELTRVLHGIVRSTPMAFPKPADLSSSRGSWLASAFCVVEMMETAG